MKKSELKTGMLVTLENKREYIVFIDCAQRFDKTSDILVSNEGFPSWIDLNYYDDDMKDETSLFDDYDIVKVEIFGHPYAFTKMANYQNDRTVIWERECKSKEQLELEELEKQQREIADRIADLSKRIK